MTPLAEAQQPAPIRGATLDDILQELKAHRPAKKDWWDRVQPVLSTFSTLILGFAGLWFTYSYNSRQAKTNEFQVQQDAETKKQQTHILQVQAVDKFIPYLTENDEHKKEMALIIITTLTDPQFATKLGELYRSPGTQAATDRIMANAVAANQASVATPAPSPTPTSSSGTPQASPAPAFRTGWVYLGAFSDQQKKWVTKYFDFADTDDPASFTGKALQVREQTGAVNVRTGMVTQGGEFQPVKDTLKPQARATVRQIQQWSSTGYMWAEVTY